MNELLTFDELSSIVGRAKVAFIDDYKKYNEEKDLQLANLCDELFVESLHCPEEFFEIKGNNPF